MPSPVDPSDMNVSASDTASASGSEDPASDTADMTFQNPTASAMNPSRLLRTALFSVLALLVAGAFVPVQAQDVTLRVNEQDGSASGDPFATIQGAVEEAQSSNTSGDIKIVVEDGVYDSSDDRPVTIDNESNLSSLTITAATDGSGNSVFPTHDAGTNSLAYEVNGVNNADITIEGLDIDAAFDGSSPSTAKVIEEGSNNSRAGTLTIRNNDIDVSTSNLTADVRVVAFGGTLNATGNSFDAGDAGNGFTTAIRGKGVSVAGGTSVNGNDFNTFGTAVQIADPGGNVTVNNNTFDDINGRTVVFVDNNSTTNSGNYTVNDNDFGNDTQVSTGVVFDVGGSGNDASDNDNYTGTLEVSGNDFFDVANEALVTTNGSGNVSGILTNEGNSINASENFFGAAGGPLDNVSEESGRDGGGSAVADGGNETIAFVPFFDAEVGTDAASRSGFDSQIFVNKSNTGTGTINDSSDPFGTLSGAIDAALPGETIIVEGRGSASDYNFQTVNGFGGNDNRVNVDSDGFESSVALQASADLSSAVTVAGIDFAQSFKSNGEEISINVEQSGSAFFRITGNTSVPSDGDTNIDITGGEVNIDGSGTLRIDGTGDRQVRRVVNNTTTIDGETVALSRIATGNIQFEGAKADLAYVLNTPNSDSPLIASASGEVPANGTVDELLIGSDTDNDDMNNTDNNESRVVFSSDVTATGGLDLDEGTGDVANLTANSAANATFEGDLTLGTGGVDIDGDSDLSVAGTLTMEATDASLKLAGNSSTFNNAITDEDDDPGAGDVRFSNLTTTSSASSDADVIEVNEGEFSAGNVTFGLDDDLVSQGQGSSNNQEFDIAISAGDDGDGSNNGTAPGSPGEVEVTITENVTVDLKQTTDKDSIDVRLKDTDAGTGTNNFSAGDASTFIVGGGDDFGELANPTSGNGNEPDTDVYNGTDIIFTGDATLRHDEGTDTDLNGNGTVAVASGATLTVENNSNGLLTYALGDGGQFAGFDDSGVTTDGSAGTVEFAGSNTSNGHKVTTSNSTGTFVPSVTAVRQTEFDGSDVGFDVGNVDAQSEVDFNTGTAGNEIGALTASAPVSFSNGGNTIASASVSALVAFGSGNGNGNSINGALSVEDAGEVQSGSETLSVDGQVNANGGNLVLGGDFTANLGLDISGDANVTSDGEVQVGSDLSAGGDATYDLGDATLAFTQDGIASEIDLATDLTVGKLEITKLAETTTLTEGSSLTVNGNVTVSNAGPSPDDALRLEEDLRVGGNFDLGTGTQAGNNVNAVSGSGSVVFTSAGSLKSTDIQNDGTSGSSGSEGEATIQSVEVASSAGGDVAVEDSLKFGVATLNGNGFDLSTVDADLSPVSDTAEVVANGASITASNGTFNAEGGDFDLTLGTTNGTTDTGTDLFNREAGDDFGLQDFTVSGGGTANLDGTAIPRGDVLVESGATLAGGGVLNLTDAASNNLNGTVEVDIESAGERTVDGGENGVVADVSATGPDADVTVIAQEVTGEVSAVDTSSVTLDLEGNDGTVGSISVNRGGQVDLDSRTIVTGNVDISGSADGDGNPNSSASVLSLGENDLVVQGDLNQNLPGAVADSAEYNSSGGAIVLDTDGDVGSSAQSIPNIAVRDADGSGSAPDPSIPSDDTLSFDESAALEAGFSGSGTLEATGTTITLDASDGDSDPNPVRVPTFTVNSGGSSVTEVIDGGSATDDESFLYATDSLNFETGELEHDARVRAANLNYSGNEFAVTATSGQIELEAAEVKLGGGLTIPVLATVGSGASSLTANSAGTEEDLTIGDELTLGQRFETDVTDTGDLVIADAEEDVLVTRTNEYPDRDILDEALTFAGDGTTYDLSYETVDDETDDITSGFEAASSADRIDSLAVALDEDPDGDPDTDDGETLTFESNADFIESDAVTANGALNLQSGNVDYGQSGLRDLAVASGASYVRSEDAILDVNNNDGLPIAVEGSGYSITYQVQDGTLEPNVREFPEGREIAGLTVEGGTRDENGNEATSGTVDFTLSRAVSGDLEVDNTSSSDLRLAADTDDDGTLDFEEELDVSGNVVIEGRGTTDGGSVSSLSVGGDVTASGGRIENFNVDGALTVSGGTASNANVAGDVSIEQGGSLEGNVTLSGEDSQALSLGADVNQAPLEDFTLAQTTSGESAAQVNLSGGDLDVDGTLTLSGGVLDAESDETVILTDGTFERNVESGEESHVAGRVEQTVSDNNLIVFPVGSAGSEYRPFEIALPEGTSRDLTIGHVTEDPGNPGLPTDADNEGVSIQSTPGYFWTAEANQSLSITESFELAIRGTDLDESNESSFRILSGAEGNDFEQVGNGTQYANSSRVADGVIDVRTVGATSAITDETRRFTIGQPTAETAEGLQIAGQVNYPTVSDGNVVDGRALEGVEVEATSGDVTATATTDADGNFTIGGLDSGDYEVTANVDRDVSNVSIGDAQRTVSGFAGTEPFAGAFQEEVADVNASGTANATDALRIAFFDLGSVSSFEAGSFLVDTTEVTLGSESESGVSIRVAEFGDADLSGGSSDSGGDASLATTTVSPKSSAQTAAQTAAKSAGDANRVAAGETFEVPVRVDRGAEVGSYSLSLEYDTEKATFEGISSGRDDIITNGSKEDGTLQVGWFDRSGESTLELTGGSELVTLRFSAAEGVEGAEFAPEITSGEINGPGAKAVAAGVETQAVRIAKPAPDEFALNGSYPNPASQQATVEMDLPVRAQVTVEVYNTLGQRVQTVEQSMSAGAGQTVQLDASQLASGQYFYRVKASLDGNQTRETGRITIVK
ncbi:hypothetical protein GGP66_003146 [Salinibacter ruber]|uniref:T9SS type A sorting domain-containing protein n=1 Tax=Salinibacter ruber TaxID=146919 RepID=UPI002168E3B2|nr:T9SS type A sorting domain-containing protein [Salinibacter ruber]MCS3675699.1 hypothetical protein [Salinibacter ruber]